MSLGIIIIFCFLDNYWCKVGVISIKNIHNNTYLLIQNKICRARLVLYYSFDELISNLATRYYINYSKVHKSIANNSFFFETKIY